MRACVYLSYSAICTGSHEACQPFEWGASKATGMMGPRCGVETKRTPPVRQATFGRSAQARDRGRHAGPLKDPRKSRIGNQAGDCVRVPLTTGYRTPQRRYQSQAIRLDLINLLVPCLEGTIGWPASSQGQEADRGHANRYGILTGTQVVDRVTVQVAGVRRG